MLVVLALLAAIVVGLVTWLTLGQAVAIGVALLLLAAGVVAQRTHGAPRRMLGSVLLLALLGVGAYGTVLAVDVLEALSTTDGPADAADASHLAAAQDKLAGVGGSSSFRLELTEPELQAVIQDGLAESTGVPVRRVDIDLRAAEQDLAFVAAFKAGGVQASGAATVRAVDGGIDIDLGPLDFGRLDVPGVAAGAIESLLSAVTDLNAALEDQGASVESVEITDRELIVVGTTGGLEELTEGELLDAVQDQAAGAADGVQAPPERIAPGRVASLDHPGEPFVLAIGDSLTANIGVDDPREGFVSRFHRHVSDVDGVEYGLLNLGISGESSASLLTSGQLADAEEALAERDAEYVTIGIGANDLLSQLTAPECNDDLGSADCSALVDETVARYTENLTVILDRLTAASGDARVLLLLTYNPFSLGLGESEQEVRASELVTRLNDAAARLATARGITVADGFTPMQATTAATTHMLDPQPDIHPNAAGYAVLAGALVDSL